MKTCFTWKPDKPREFPLRHICLTLKGRYVFKVLFIANELCFLFQFSSNTYACDLHLKDVEGFCSGPKGTWSAIRTPFVQ